MKNIFFAFVSLSFILTSCTEIVAPTSTLNDTVVVEVVAPAENQSQYKNDEITFNYPNNWEITSDTVEGQMVIMVLSPTSEEDSFQENINFLTYDYSKDNLDFDTFVSRNLEGLRLMVSKNNGKVISEPEAITVNGQQGQKLIAEFSSYGVTSYTTQYYFGKNGKGYIITIAESPKEK